MDLIETKDLIGTVRGSPWTNSVRIADVKPAKPALSLSFRFIPEGRLAGRYLHWTVLNILLRLSLSFLTEDFTRSDRSDSTQSNTST